ncbi:hypothetical protein FKM82_004450 [Ascaphus truei]
MGDKKRYHVERSVLHEADLGGTSSQSMDEVRRLLSTARRKVRCSRSAAKSLLLQFLPILRWLPQYPVKEWLMGDIISGLSVGILQLPQGLAYALLAGVPPVFGLYSSFFPVFVYSFFGKSRHISAGTFAVISIMIGSVTESLVPNENFMLPGNETLVNTTARDKARVELAAAMSLLVGLFQVKSLCQKPVSLGLVQFGFVVTYLSEPLIRGYTTAATIHVTVSQLKHIFGLPGASQKSQPLSLIYLIISTGISYGVNLHEGFGVAIVGDIPTGMIAPTVPKVNLLANIVGNAFAIAMVGYAVMISLAKMFAMKNNYKVDSNQELIALGLSNLTGSFFQCFPITASMSRSLVQESTGGKTQIAGSVSSFIILICILKAGELFTSLPKAILSTIVIANLKGMYKQFMDLPILWRTNKYDLLIWLVTFLSTICLNLDMGLAVSIAFGLLTVTFRTQSPQCSILGQVPETDVYRDVAENNQAKEIPGVKIFRYTSAIYFANAELFAKALQDKVGVNVDRLKEKKKKVIRKRNRGLQKMINMSQKIVAETQKVCHSFKY